MDIERWESFGYTSELKAKTIAWWQLSGEIATHQQDAKNRKEEKMMRSKKRR